MPRRNFGTQAKLLCGAIGSANKYAIQDRLKKAGMQWSIRGGKLKAKLRTMNFAFTYDGEGQNVSVPT